jgi:hypothetical protein
MWEFINPGEPGRGFPEIAAAGPIPSMDEKVPVGHRNSPVLVVGVANADDPHPGQLPGLMGHPTMVIGHLRSSMFGGIQHPFNLVS